MNAEARKNRFSVSFFLVLALVAILSFCVIIGTAVAWLSKTYEIEDNRSELGSVGIQILYDNNIVSPSTYTDNGGLITWEYNEPYTVNSGTNDRNVDIKMINTGTIDALVRARIRIYYFDSNNNQVTVINSSGAPATGSFINLTTSDWVYSFPEDVVCAGYMFYNNRLSPYNYRDWTGDNETGTQTSSPVSENKISIIDKIRTPEVNKSVIYYIEVSVDAIAWAGNIYGVTEKIEEGSDASRLPTAGQSAYPFGAKENLPSDWQTWKLDH